MTIHIQTDIFCEGEGCNKLFEGAGSRTKGLINRARAAAWSEGWRLVRIKGEQMDLCPECATNYRETGIAGVDSNENVWLAKQPAVTVEQGTAFFTKLASDLNNLLATMEADGSLMVDWDNHSRKTVLVPVKKPDIRHVVDYYEADGAEYCRACAVKELARLKEEYLAGLTVEERAAWDKAQEEAISYRESLDQEDYFYDPESDYKLSIIDGSDGVLDWVDAPVSCATCDRDLFYTLSDTGIADEIQSYKDARKNGTLFQLSYTDLFGLSQIIESMTADDMTNKKYYYFFEEMAELVKRFSDIYRADLAALKQG